MDNAAKYIECTTRSVFQSMRQNATNNIDFPMPKSANQFPNIFLKLTNISQIDCFKEITNWKWTKLTQT